MGQSSKEKGIPDGENSGAKHKAVIMFGESEVVRVRTHGKKGWGEGDKNERGGAGGGCLGDWA